MYTADLHIHSRYSYGTSRDSSLKQLAYWAGRKGLDVVGTGDFTHPAWRQELKECLEETGTGFYKLKTDWGSPKTMGGATEFVITGEISSIYKKGGRTRRVHSLLILPGFREAEELSDRLAKIGNIISDGRPILALDCHDLMEMVLEVSRDIIYIPAHVWTPHFSMFGAFTGFNSIEECFGDLAPYVHALETGLSSDPAMNWRISALDPYQLVSSSDAHSPAKLGREAALISGEKSYEGLWKAIQLGYGLEGTLEFFPEEGKYHEDGHRKCHFRATPQEAEKMAGICPVCGKKMTFGVRHRIEQLADREVGYMPENPRRFERLVPLPEILAASMGLASISSKRVAQQYEQLISALGPELAILREVPEEDIRQTGGEKLAGGISRMRLGVVTCDPGYDGEYGTIHLWDEK